MADTHASTPLAIICGGGSFPAAVADAVAARGRRPVMFGIKGWAEAEVIGRYAHHWIAIGQAGRFFRLAKAENCREALFIGTVLRPPIKDLRLDWHTVKALEQQYMREQLRRAGTPGPRVIGLDEVSLRRGHTYRIVVTDLIRERAIWFGGTESLRGKPGCLLHLARAAEKPAHPGGGDGYVESLPWLDPPSCAAGEHPLRQVPCPAAPRRRPRSRAQERVSRTRSTRSSPIGRTFPWMAGES